MPSISTARSVPTSNVISSHLQTPELRYRRIEATNPLLRTLPRTRGHLAELPDLHPSIAAGERSSHCGANSS